MKNSIYFIIGLSLFNSVQASPVCTPPGTIESLWPRAGGWVHIKMKGVEDMNLSKCGEVGALGLILNFNDTDGTKEGKQMVYSSLLSAFMAGKKLQLCSYACDSQHYHHSRLDHINALK